MGGPYNIPRNYKGEGKILYIFSTKSFLYTIVGAGIGLVFYFIFKIIKFNFIGLIFVVLFAFIGFVIGTFKIPDNANMEFSKKVGGESIDSVILKWIKFKRKNNRIYIYKEEEYNDDK